MPAVGPPPERATPAIKNPIAGGLPGRANATIRSPAAPIVSPRSGSRHGATAPYKALIRRDYLFYDCSETAAPRPDRSRRGRDFRSLRLSVRTPPFHGGESGSIPLGSAIPPSADLFRAPAPDLGRRGVARRR